MRCILVLLALCGAVGAGYWLGANQPIQFDGRPVELHNNRTWAYIDPLDIRQEQDGVEYQLVDMNPAPLLIGRDRYEDQLVCLFIRSADVGGVRLGKVEARLFDEEGRLLVKSRAFSLGRGGELVEALPPDVTKGKEAFTVYFRPDRLPESFTAEIIDSRSGEPLTFRFEGLERGPATAR